jgi:hypothetical protein
MPTKQLQACDILFVQSQTILGKLIRKFSQVFGESRTKVNHVGIVVQGGKPSEAVIVEALQRTRKINFYKAYRNKFCKLAIYRAKNLTLEQKRTISEKAESYIGKKYGYIKILAHWLDWLFLGAYVFRRLTKMDKYPICSYLVAQSFAEGGKFFGMHPGQAQPDDMWDFVVSHHDKYEKVYGLDLIEDWS